VGKSGQATIERIINDEMKILEKGEAMQMALNQIRDIQAPLLEEWSKLVTETTKKFIPNVKSVAFSINEKERILALRKTIQIHVDDGTDTPLEAKGDGIQSLVALGLRRHIIDSQRGNKAYIFAIEEPEAHLHPNAVHELKSVISDISRDDQIIVTTHSPILVNRQNLKSNVIVRNSVARPAEDIATIRRILGVRSYDNLVSADVVVIVEGQSDVKIVKRMLHFSEKLASAINSNRLVIEPSHSASKIATQVQMYKSLLCAVHCIFDYDKAGKMAQKHVISSDLIGQSDFHYARLTGLEESEIEDLIDSSIVQSYLTNYHGVNFGKNLKNVQGKKFSERIKYIFSSSGHELDEATLAKVKAGLATTVEESHASPFTAHAADLIAALVKQIEQKLSG
jgi:putative ATP-dependent endonuclease of OLD family